MVPPGSFGAVDVMTLQREVNPRSLPTNSVTPINVQNLAKAPTAGEPNNPPSGLVGGRAGSDSQRSEAVCPQPPGQPAYGGAALTTAKVAPTPARALSVNAVAAIR